MARAIIRTVSPFVLYIVERAPMIHMILFQADFHSFFSPSRYNENKIQARKVRSRFVRISRAPQECRVTDLELNLSTRNLQFEIFKRGRHSSLRTETKLNLGEGSETRWAMRVRERRWIQIYASSFFFPFPFPSLSFFSYPLVIVKSPCARSKDRIASLSRDSGSRTCAHAQFMQVGIRGWKVAPIDSNFSSSFIKIIPQLDWWKEGTEERLFSKESRRFIRIFGIIIEYLKSCFFFSFKEPRTEYNFIVERESAFDTQTSGK